MRLDLWELETSGGPDGGGGGSESSPTPPSETPAPDSTTPASTASTGADEWRPSKDEWETVVGGLGYIAQQLFAEEGGSEGGEDVDLSDPNAQAKYFKEYVDSQTSRVAEFAQPAVIEAGERKLAALFDNFAKKPDIGDFDRELAKEIAEARWSPGQDPAQVAEAAARRAAEIGKKYKDMGAEELKKTFNPGFGSSDDEPVLSSAQRGLKPARTYDEVTERYTGNMDVG